MKPFNLERALAGAKVITRDGREVTQLVKFENTYLSYPVHGVVDGTVFNFNEEGEFYYSCGTHYLDLFMAPETKEVWVNVYKNGGGTLCIGGALYQSEYEALSYGKLSMNHHSTHKITIEI